MPSNVVSFAERFARNPSIKEILFGVQNRISWKLYSAKVCANWKQWDTIESQHRSRPLSIETLYEHAWSNPLDGDPVLMNPDIRKQCSSTGRPFNDFVWRINEPVTLEPTFGFAIADPGRVVPNSHPGMEISRDKTRMMAYSGVPSLDAYNIHRKKESHSSREPRLITFRHYHERNYYHCYIDVMSRLHLLDMAGIDPAIPIVVGPSLANCKYFQQMITKGDLAKRRWIVHDKFLDTDELIYTEVANGIPNHVEYVLDLMKIAPADPRNSRRVFLTRDKKYGRHLVNMDEIQPVLDEYGFEVVDTDGLPLDEQIKLFQEVGFLIGLHGAGLTNIIYRRGAPLRLLEIFDPNATPLYFYTLCKSLGYQHDYIVGFDPQNNTNKTPYRLNPETLRERLSSVGIN